MRDRKSLLTRDVPGKTTSLHSSGGVSNFLGLVLVALLCTYAKMHRRQMRCFHVLGRSELRPCLDSTFQTCAEEREQCCVSAHLLCLPGGDIDWRNASRWGDRKRKRCMFWFQRDGTREQFHCWNLLFPNQINGILDLLPGLIYDRYISHER